MHVVTADGPLGSIRVGASNRAGAFPATLVRVRMLFDLGSSHRVQLDSEAACRVLEDGTLAPVLIAKLNH